MHRRNIHYWKCDRPAAFHGTSPDPAQRATIQSSLESVIQTHLKKSHLQLKPADGQGIHLTWTAQLDGRPIFIRVAHGPESSAQLSVESTLLQKLASLQIPVPEVIATDDSRKQVPFGWQILELIPHPDLNHWQKQGTLNTSTIPFQIGQSIAQWQRVNVRGFGILELNPEGTLNAPHQGYSDYFHLNLERHLHFLRSNNFLPSIVVDQINHCITASDHLTDLDQGCLVHKDLALWNILGTQDQVKAFIDFEDAISGDPSDDISLLACFHPAPFILEVLKGFTSVKPLPLNFIHRFWLHLLRNMIVKAVIRVGAGYFHRSDAFFLIQQGSSGETLRAFTLDRIRRALDGLQNNLPISTTSLP